MGRREESEKEDTCGCPGAIEEKRERAPVLRDYSSEKRAACEYRVATKGTGKRKRVPTVASRERSPGGDSSVAWSRDGNKQIGENARGDVRASLRSHKSIEAKRCWLHSRAGRLLIVVKRRSVGNVI